MNAVDFIHSLGRKLKADENNLMKIAECLDILGNPHKDLKYIHVAGTNGKGSTVQMFASIFEFAGYNTGKFISPFIRVFNERISVNRINISDKELDLLTYEIRQKIDCSVLSEFEFITILAFLYFKRKNCDMVILETGLGGSLDPTNVIESPIVSVITTVDYDHVEILGDTLEKITYWKCGIIKENSICAASPKNTAAVLEQIKKAAADKNSIFMSPDVNLLEIKDISVNGSTFVYKDMEYRVGLTGEHQIYNALTVIEVADYLKLPAEAIKKALSSAHFPARFEVLSSKPLMIFDGAHNMSGITALNKTLNDIFDGRTVNLFFGMLKSKEPEKIIAGYFKSEKKYKTGYFCTIPVNMPGAAIPCELLTYVRRFHDNVRAFDMLGEAVEYARVNMQNDVNVFFGSLYLAGDVIGAISTPL